MNDSQEKDWNEEKEVKKRKKQEKKLKKLANKKRATQRVMSSSARNKCKLHF